MYFLDIIDIKDWADHPGYDPYKTVFFFDNDFENDKFFMYFFPSQLLELQNVLCYLGCLDSELL